ncbi:MAG TPA: hypothetical protein VHM70_10990 [Polyangiaceae bacterium]|jgi:hypothetical protein|nr:hypothetical protein [Polyangiaceae bacterium]
MTPIQRDAPTRSLLAFVRHINQVRDAIVAPPTDPPCSVVADQPGTLCEELPLHEQAQIVAAGVSSLSDFSLVFRRGNECEASTPQSSEKR